MGTTGVRARPVAPRSENRDGDAPRPTKPGPGTSAERSNQRQPGNGDSNPAAAPWGRGLELEGTQILPERGRLRGPGVTIAPHRLRAARVAAGLSLAQLSAGLVTRAAVHLYETGRARPSRAVLEALALRLGQPVDGFLVPVDPDEARRDVAVEITALARHLERLAIVTTEPDGGKVLRAIAGNLRREADAVARVLPHRGRHL